MFRLCSRRVLFRSSPIFKRVERNIAINSTFIRATPYSVSSDHRQQSVWTTIRRTFEDDPLGDDMEETPTGDSYEGEGLSFDENGDPVIDAEAQGRVDEHVQMLTARIRDKESGSRGRSSADNDESFQEALGDNDISAMSRLLHHMPSPTDQMYLDYYETILSCGYFYLIPRLFELMASRNGMQPSEELFDQLIETFAKRNYFQQIRNVILAMPRYQLYPDTTTILTIIRALLKVGNIEEALYYYNLAQISGLYTKEMFDILLQFIPTMENEALYRLMKKEIVRVRAMTHSSIRVDHYHSLFGMCLQMGKWQEALEMHNFSLDNGEIVPIHFSNMLLHQLLEENEFPNDNNDTVRKFFFRCIARSIRFTDRAVNIVLQRFFNTGDYQSTINCFRIALRDSHALYKQSYLAAIRAMIAQSTPDILPLAIETLLTAPIGNEARGHLFDHMVVRACSLNDGSDYRLAFDSLRKDLMNTDQHSLRVRAGLVQYYLSKHELDTAISLFLRTMDQAEIKLLNHKVFETIYKPEVMPKVYDPRDPVGRFIRTTLNRKDGFAFDNTISDADYEQGEWVRDITRAVMNDTNATSDDEASIGSLRATNTIPTKSYDGYLPKTADEAAREREQIKQRIQADKVEKVEYEQMEKSAPGFYAERADKLEILRSTGVNVEEDDHQINIRASDNSDIKEKILQTALKITGTSLNETESATEVESELDDHESTDEETDKETANTSDKTINNEESESNESENNISDEDTNNESEDINDIIDNEEDEGSESEKDISDEDTDRETRNAKIQKQNKKQLDTIVAAGNKPTRTPPVSHHQLRYAVNAPEDEQNPDISTLDPELVEIRYLTRDNVARSIPKMFDQFGYIGYISEQDTQFPPDLKMYDDYEYIYDIPSKFMNVLPKMTEFGSDYKTSSEYTALHEMYQSLYLYVRVNQGTLAAVDLFKRLSIKATTQLFDINLFDNLMVDLFVNFNYSVAQLIELIDYLGITPSYEGIRYLCDRLIFQEKQFVAAETFANKFFSVRAGKIPFDNVLSRIAQEMVKNNVAPKPLTFYNVSHYFDSHLPTVCYERAFALNVEAENYLDAALIAALAHHQIEEKDLLVQLADTLKDNPKHQQLYETVAKLSQHQNRTEFEAM